ncbi:MAG: hypothetical protein INQ03_25670 [Candidatus Heimdallarchaeota archaeon]|nr:hypothetical protein [Candidatus Heimdallarchaeota archaeon]
MSSTSLTKEKHNGFARILMIISALFYIVASFMDMVYIRYFRDFDDYNSYDVSYRYYTLSELDSITPLIMNYLAVILLIFGWFRARKGYSAKRYTWSTLILQVIVFYSSVMTIAQMEYELTDRYYMVDTFGFSVAIYMILIGAIIAFLAGAFSKTKFIQIPIAQQGRMGFQPAQQFPYGQPQQQQFPYQPPRSREVQPAPQQQGPPKKIVRCNTCGFNDDEGEGYCSQCGSKL